MTNANPLIQLRNQAIKWIAIGGVSFIAAWYVYGIFVGENASILTEVNELSNTLTTIQKEGVITQKNWEELTSDEKKNERWKTITQLVPSIQKLVGAGTPTSAKNISTIKSITTKVSDTDYIPWLQKSWTAEAASALEKTQSDIAEIIPVFTGVSEMTSTRDIAGKITIKSLNDYIQTNIVDRFALVNAFGQIGISQVHFLPEAPEIGVYEIPLRFERVNNANVAKMLEFLGKTGGVRVTETDKNVTIEHQYTESPSSTDPSISGLKNLLITVNDLTVTPAKVEGKDETIKMVSTATQSLWDVNITLQFYIRGVSRDHIASLDATLVTLLDTTGKSTSLITQGNALLKTCNGCQEASHISDIITLLRNARAAYDSIIKEEKNPKKVFTPIEILEHRTELMTTVDTLQRKLDTIKNALTSSTV